MFTKHLLIHRITFVILCIKGDSIIAPVNQRLFKSLYKIFLISIHLNNPYLLNKEIKTEEFCIK